ncbi:MAG TPA: DNA polymerase [Streptosporangiaceae bacterium]
MTGSHPGSLAEWLRDADVRRGGLVGLAVLPGGTSAAVATSPSAQDTWTGEVADIGAADIEVRPRWVIWSGATACSLVDRGVRLATSWDVAAVHRLLAGGWRADPGMAWASMHGLKAPDASSGAPDLFDLSDDCAQPVDDDGQLRPSWVNGGWAEGGATAGGTDRAGHWAALALEVAGRQRTALSQQNGAQRNGSRLSPLAVAASESAAELLCAELGHDGLPVNRDLIEDLLAAMIGPRPRNDAEALRLRAARDAEVLAFAPDGMTCDLRSNAQVLRLLRTIGVDVPDTRAHRLKAHRDQHPLVNALLEWRKAERIATTYGYSWLDACLSANGRLRGSWTGCDGAAGRMTASAGLHNMPATLRAGVVAEPGHVFVRADLGQIEPRVLAAVSGDAGLAAAATAEDLYAPVAAALGVDRPTAKVAVLGAMYGQRTGHGAAAGRRLRSAYPVAMEYLEAGDRAAQAGTDLRTYGGRLVLMRASAGESPAQAAARGRYGRNALVQGAAAEFFKMWAVTVRARLASGAAIVLCLHDELLVHAPAADGEATAELVEACLRETAARWAPGSAVRFISDTRVMSAWSDAKGGLPDRRVRVGPVTGAEQLVGEQAAGRRPGLAGRQASRGRWGIEYSPPWLIRCAAACSPCSRSTARRWRARWPAGPARRSGT